MLLKRVKKKTVSLYEDLQRVVDESTSLLINNVYKHLVIVGSMNTGVGKISIPKVVGTFIENHLNRNGVALRHFADFNKLKITNTFYLKKEKTQIYVGCKRYNIIGRLCNGE